MDTGREVRPKLCERYGEVELLGAVDGRAGERDGGAGEDPVEVDEGSPKLDWVRFEEYDGGASMMEERVCWRREYAGGGSMLEGEYARGSMQEERVDGAYIRT